MRSVLVAGLLVGCTQGASAVRGEYVYRYPDGTTVPVDLSASRFQIYVADATGFVSYPATPVAGTADGRFEIADVPVGPFLVRRSSGGFYGEFTPGDDHVFRQTWDVLGRPGAAPSSQPTALQIDAMGLAAWQPGDRLMVDCFGNATEVLDPPLTPPLAAGALEVHASLAWDAGYSWGPTGNPYLMDPGAGDAVVITHAHVRRTGDLVLRNLSQVLDAPAPVQVDGQPSAIAGAFVDAEPTGQLAVTVRGDALAALVPDGTVPHDLGASVIVGPATARSWLLGPELASMSTSRAKTAATATLDYADPFDPAWPPVVAAWYTAVRDVRLANGSALPSTFTAFSETRPLGAAGYTFEPLAPLGALTIDGVPPGDEITVPHGQHVRVDFAAPPEMTSGRVIVWRTSGLHEEAYVAIDHLPIDLPPDIFESGERYALQIDVYADDGNGRIRSAGTYTDSFQLVAR